MINSFHPLLIVLALLIVIGLAVYAGMLLAKLRQQQKSQQQVRQKRIASITESIQTIAKAMSQEQCDLSEGAIRICRLLDSLPILPLPDFSKSYPALHKLDKAVSKFATHQARKSLSKTERDAQDIEREEIESQLSADIHKELPALIQFKI